MFSLSLYVCSFLGQVQTRLDIIQFKHVTVMYIHETNFLDPIDCIFLYHTLFAQFHIIKYLLSMFIISLHLKKVSLNLEKSFDTDIHPKY